MDISGNDPGRHERTPARFILSPFIYLVLRLFLGGLFLYSGAVKLADTAGFSQAISAYRILPDPLVPCAAMGLPAIELAVGIGTLLNRRWAILGMLALMVLFLGVLSYGVAIGLDIDCGCFSSDESPAPATDLSSPPVDIGGPGGGEPGTTFVPIDPAGGPETGEETCSEGSAGPSRLLNALMRDVLLFFGVLYLVAWPDLRRRYWEGGPSHVPSPTSNV